MTIDSPGEGAPGLPTPRPIDSHEGFPITASEETPVSTSVDRTTIVSEAKPSRRTSTRIRKRPDRDDSWLIPGGASGTPRSRSARREIARRSVSVPTGSPGRAGPGAASAAAGDREGGDNKDGDDGNNGIQDDDDDDDDDGDDDDDDDEEAIPGLEQVEPLSPGPPGSDLCAPFHVRLHPCACALLQLHAHLAQTEVIGYLGGVVAGGTVYVVETFPARCLTASELARSGRDAYSEVEMDPESDVEVRMRISRRGMRIVGWYHSHPYFSTRPSRVDVDNQHNYQTLLFRGVPYVAAICSPFWDGLQDDSAAIDMFYVRGDEQIPVWVEYEMTCARPPKEDTATKEYYEVTENRPDEIELKERSDVKRQDMVRVIRWADCDRLTKFQLASFENEAMNLISMYVHLPRRTDLLKEWRPGVNVLQKLRLSLDALCSELNRRDGNTEHDGKLAEAAALPGVCPASTRVCPSSIGQQVTASLATIPGAHHESRTQPQDAEEMNQGEDESAGQSRAKFATGSIANTSSRADRGQREWSQNARDLSDVFHRVLMLYEDAWHSALNERRATAAANVARKRRRRRRGYA